MGLPLHGQGLGGAMCSLTLVPTLVHLVLAIVMGLSAAALIAGDGDER